MSSDEDGITTKDLAAAVKKVRGKISILKQRHVLKAKRRAVSKIKNLDEMTEALEKKGIDVNKESLATRVKNFKRIDDLEYAQEMKAREELGIEGDDSDESGMSLMSDEELKQEEGEKRGRKGKREAENERRRSESKIKNRAGENSDMMRK